MYKSQERNFEGIQFADIRKKIDAEFNDAHDELSDCFYNNKEYKDYGILDKETFDKIHALIFHNREVALADEYEKNSKYYTDPKLAIYMVENATKIDEIKNVINNFKNEGISI